MLLSYCADEPCLMNFCRDLCLFNLCPNVIKCKPYPLDKKQNYYKILLLFMSKLKYCV
jgi:hypothetical protein